jgi:hypothetical protein
MLTAVLGWSLGMLDSHFGSRLQKNIRHDYLVMDFVEHLEGCREYRVNFSCRIILLATSSIGVTAHVTCPPSAVFFTDDILVGNVLHWRYSYCRNCSLPLFDYIRTGD